MCAGKEKRGSQWIIKKSKYSASNTRYSFNLIVYTEENYPNQFIIVDTLTTWANRLQHEKPSHITEASRCLTASRTSSLNHVFPMASHGIHFFFFFGFVLFCDSMSTTWNEISAEGRVQMLADKRTNTTMLLCIFHSHLKKNSLCWGPAPSRTFPWCPCWQRWWGCRCRSVWSCGMWRSSEGPPEGDETWLVLRHEL